MGKGGRHDRGCREGGMEEGGRTKEDGRQKADRREEGEGSSTRSISLPHLLRNV